MTGTSSQRLACSAYAPRLAPLYDIASALPYEEAALQKLKLAMRIGGEYRIRDIGKRQWEKLAGELKIDAAALVASVFALIDEALPAVDEIAAYVASEGLGHPVLGKITKAIRARAEQIRMIV